jgi:hypothetical protein
MTKARTHGWSGFDRDRKKQMREKHYIVPDSGKRNFPIGLSMVERPVMVFYYHKIVLQCPSIELALSDSPSLYTAQQT